MGPLPARPIPQRRDGDAADAERDPDAGPPRRARPARRRTQAKSPRWRLTSSKALPTPDREADLGSRHSPCPIAVSIGPKKNSSAGIDAGRQLSPSTIAAPSTTAPAESRPTDRHSRSSRRRCRGCGSAHGRPRAAPAQQRHAARMTGSCSTSPGAWWRRQRRAGLVASCKLRQRLMSISFAGRASRIAIIGTRLCPPAINRASSSPASSSHASASEPGPGHMRKMLVSSRSRNFGGQLVENRCLGLEDDRSREPKPSNPN